MDCIVLAVNPQHDVLTQCMVTELIDRIDVYHAEKQDDGITTQHVVIHFQHKKSGVALQGYSDPISTLRMCHLLNLDAYSNYAHKILINFRSRLR
ncbi:MAG: DUF4368 domain-containing protein [Clostridiaceae bacterium]|nr:DUF4368 domain-containing protein [Clostridiaceae bacterium]